ncbi:MAG: hypothetical protein V4538_15725 [Bacteroidota bacterium]
MKKQISFRIIELPTHQVLVSKDFDQDENDKPLLVLTFNLDGLIMSVKMGYDNETDRDKYFDTISEETAQTFLNDFIKLTK